MFGLLYYSVERQEQVRQIKREHPTLVMLVTFLAGQFLIYQVIESPKIMIRKVCFVYRAAVCLCSLAARSFPCYSPFFMLLSD